jgi:hypothetical protein
MYSGTLHPQANLIAICVFSIKLSIAFALCGWFRHQSTVHEADEVAHPKLATRSPASNAAIGPAHFCGRRETVISARSLPAQTPSLIRASLITPSLIRPSLLPTDQGVRDDAAGSPRRIRRQVAKSVPVNMKPNV